LREIWNPLLIWQSVGDAVLVNQLDNLGAAYVDLLTTAMSDVDQFNSTPQEEQQWTTVIMELREHLCVELCDPNLAPAITQIWNKILQQQNSKSIQTIGKQLFLPETNVNASADSDSNSTIPTPPLLYGILRIVFSDADEDADVDADAERSPDDENGKQVAAAGSAPGVGSDWDEKDSSPSPSKSLSSSRTRVRENLVSWFRDLIGSMSGYDSLILNLLNSFCEFDGDKFVGSALEQLRMEIKLRETKPKNKQK